jgi:kumamolisin
MARSPKFVPIPGSDKTLPSGAKYLGPIDPGQRIEVMLMLRPKTRWTEPPGGEVRSRITREDLAARHGAAAADVDRVVRFARDNGLDVVSKDEARRSVVLAGPADKLFTAIQAKAGHYEHEGRRFRGREGAIHLPSEIAEVVEGVFGIDDRPAAKPHMRLAKTGIAPRAAGIHSFTPLELGSIYGFPPDVTGKGQCIAVIELGGGYRQQDLDNYFKKLGVKGPKVVAVSVDSGANAPTGSADGPDGEVMLDIEVAGALAPDATIAVYFAPNTDRGFLDAILAAIHDQQNRPDIISISWGSAESGWTKQALTAFDQAFASAAAVGVTVCCAAGDNGSTDGVQDGRFHVDFPASSPHVLACGGTRLVVSQGAPNETVWNELAAGEGATGGGVSAVFGLPSWQQSANVPPSANPEHTIGRGVPDVAGDADPTTGYAVLVDGKDQVIGGTSAVAPLWAALIARCNEKLGQSVGFVNPALYKRAASAFHDVVEGSNGPGAYEARAGWDACTGLGTPIGDRLLQQLSSRAATQPSA